MEIREHVPLAPFTTFELGGPARFFVEARDARVVEEALGWARREGIPVLILGGGSNLVVGDAGFDGLALRVAHRGTSWGAPSGGELRVTAEAGEPWDPFVAETVARGLAGLECLSGIPGMVGAAPIQNVGAYGQEVSETIESCWVIDRLDQGVRRIPAEQCGFAYRDSFFKQAPDRFVILSVTFRLKPGGAPSVRYGELERALAAEPSAGLALVRERVLALRRRKSMVLDPDDPNRRCAGSFFTNPIVPDAEAARVVERALAEGVVDDAAEVPRWPAGEGRTKLAAGWLIERAGVLKGTRHGQVGISSRHCLALVHHGGGTTGDLLALARDVRDRVEHAWSITLAPEPTLVACAL